MRAYRVEFSPEARDQAESVAAWWNDHRPAGPTLFRDELAGAVGKLETAPSAGTEYKPVPQIRRVLMPRSRYHVYDFVDEATAVVQVRAIWHCSRGQGPPF
ncbi:MAG: type II toxin-antitoxin system RelE/ParE family toxin [Myxococcales bacterium]|nr:type II toxin-antitoxin system RelE/ParE family toxin [Myxococcales bacterium]